jgi:hypothetical protein
LSSIAEPRTWVVPLLASVANSPVAVDAVGVADCRSTRTARMGSECTRTRSRRRHRRTPRPRRCPRLARLSVVVDRRASDVGRSPTCICCKFAGGSRRGRSGTGRTPRRSERHRQPAHVESVHAGDGESFRGLKVASCWEEGNHSLVRCRRSQSLGRGSFPYLHLLQIRHRQPAHVESVHAGDGESFRGLKDNSARGHSLTPPRSAPGSLGSGRLVLGRREPLACPLSSIAEPRTSTTPTHSETSPLSSSRSNSSPVDNQPLRPRLLPPANECARFAWIWSPRVGKKGTTRLSVVVDRRASDVGPPTSARGVSTCRRW